MKKVIYSQDHAGYLVGDDWVPKVIRRCEKLILAGWGNNLFSLKKHFYLIILFFIIAYNTHVVVIMC